MQRNSDQFDRGHDQMHLPRNITLKDFVIAGCWNCLKDNPYIVVVTCTSNLGSESGSGEGSFIEENQFRVRVRGSGNLMVASRCLLHGAGLTFQTRSAMLWSHHACAIACTATARPTARTPAGPLTDATTRQHCPCDVIRVESSRDFVLRGHSDSQSCHCTSF